MIHSPALQLFITNNFELHILEVKTIIIHINICTGPGGVAASKPVATAIAGVGGLAIARPIATAIAGVSPEDAVVPVISDGYVSFPQKKKEKPPKKEDKNKETKKEEKSLEDYLVGYEQNFER